MFSVVTPDVLLEVTKQPETTPGNSGADNFVATLTRCPPFIGRTNEAVPACLPQPSGEATCDTIWKLMAAPSCCPFLSGVRGRQRGRRKRPKVWGILFRPLHLFLLLSKREKKTLVTPLLSYFSSAYVIAPFKFFGGRKVCTP